MFKYPAQISNICGLKKIFINTKFVQERSFLSSGGPKL